jgi:hypothetical protein
MRGQRFLHLLILPAVRVHRFPQARGRVPEGIGESGPQTEPAKEVGSSLRYFLQTEWFGGVHAESSVFTAAAKAVTGPRFGVSDSRQLGSGTGSRVEKDREWL